MLENPAEVSRVGVMPLQGAPLYHKLVGKVIKYFAGKRERRYSTYAFYENYFWGPQENQPGQECHQTYRDAGARTVAQDQFWPGPEVDFEGVEGGEGRRGYRSQPQLVYISAPANFADGESVRPCNGFQVDDFSFAQLVVVGDHVDSRTVIVGQVLYEFQHFSRVST